MSRSGCIVFVSALALAGCADTSMKDLKSFVEEVKARPAGPI